MRPNTPTPTSSTVTRRTFIAGAAAGAAVVSLPAWPSTAHAAGLVTPTGIPILEDHPAVEPSGTHIRSISGTNVVFAYGAVVPSFDGWNIQQPQRQYYSLDRPWKFQFDPKNDGKKNGWHQPLFNDHAWESVSVPATWDLQDTPGFSSLDGSHFGEGTAFADGYAWFRTTVALGRVTRGRHLRLNFLAVGYSADVWVNGAYLGKHEGASTPFSLPIGDPKRLGNVLLIAVRVFRRASYTDYLDGASPVSDDLEIPYKPVDYWPYAGIVHSVWLEAVNKVSVTKMLLASTGSDVTCRVIVENHGTEAFDGTLQLDTGQRREIQQKLHVPSRSAVVARFTFTSHGSARWSPTKPVVHTARASLTDGRDPRRTVDTLTATYGLRDISTAGTSLSIDGKTLFLKGINWHEENAERGRSLTRADYNRELSRVLDLGVNFIRNCVYNRHPYVYDWADKNGVLVMDDLDTMWLNTPQQKLQTESYGLSRAMALNMAWNQHNRPSVILWGLQNESEIDAAGAPVYRAWLSQLKQAVNDVDLTRRPVTWASSTTNDPAFDLADVIGFNEYFGYFYGQTGDLGPALDAAHAAHPGKPLLITENGTWALPGSHGPADQQGTEEWQAEYIAEHWDLVTQRRSFMAGYTAWVLKDYKERDGYNQAYNGVSVLGLLTFDTETPKLGYDRYRDLE